MKVKIKLLSDTIFGSGMSIPGAEDISILTDSDGFPYLKGATLKGILREETENWLYWTNGPENWIPKRFGHSGIYNDNENYKIYVSDFCLPEVIKSEIKQETSAVTDVLTSFRTFTQLEDGLAKDTSLRIARCINKGLIFYGEIKCNKEDEELLKSVLSSICWIGSMRTRGFGKVEISAF